jgi:hypothetical protein
MSVAVLTAHGSVPHGYKPQAQYAEKYALVVASENYAEFPKVENALRDGLAISDALLRAHYSFVRFIPDPPSTDVIIDRIDELSKIALADTQPAVLTVFYAGHGFRSAIDNYIVPTGARPGDLVRDSLPVSKIMHMVSPNRFILGIIFLDACRTVLTLNGKNSQTPMKEGLPVGFEAFPENGITVVGMAASARQAAESIGKDHSENSPYSWALSTYIPTTRSLDSLFDVVNSYVKQDTNERQQPEENKRAGTNGFFLLPGEKEDREQDQAWQAVMDSGARRKCLEDYVNRYPAGRYSNAAQYLIGITPAQTSEPNCIL